jgi:hypothetical protein
VLRGAAAARRDQLPPGVEEAQSSQLAERSEPTDFSEGLGRADAELAGRMQLPELRRLGGSI